MSRTWKSGGRRKGVGICKARIEARRREEGEILEDIAYWLAAWREGAVPAQGEESQKSA